MRHGDRAESSDVRSSAKQSVAMPVRIIQWSVTIVSVGLLLGAPAAARAQQPDSAGQDHSQHERMQMTPPSETWDFMQDGVLFALVNHQGGPRGGDQFVVPNWWMGTASRNVGGSRLTLNAMLSLDPATVGKKGYREIFQVGEAVDGQPLIDRQHPHDLFMQLAAVWRMPLTASIGLTIAGGPAGEPALGPIAFMHRASAAEMPFAPLGHHTFDSTHIAFGVVTAAVDHGPWTIEGSVFNGREPDEDRWDIDFGKLDSVSGRIWYKPSEEWELQASTGHLVEPEELEPGNVQRSTGSASWLRKNGTDFSAATVGYGINAAHGTTRQSVFGEATRRRGATAIFGRAELTQVETGLLLEAGDAAGRRDTVGAFTIGAVRDLVRWRGFEGGAGAMVTWYAVPDALQATHGRRPVSAQIFFRLRPPAGAMGRMLNMRMARPMSGHDMASMHHEP
jgi:hypothetical protein